MTFREWVWEYTIEICYFCCAVAFAGIVSTAVVYF